jgi:transposase
VPLEKVITAILFVLSEGCTWRAINQPGVNWNTVYRYYRKWCRDGLWKKVWETIAPPPVGKTIYIDSSHVKVHRCGLNPRGGREAQAIGKTKGGWNTKVHAAVDNSGAPRAILLTPGNAADVTYATDLMTYLTPGAMAADKGYDCDALRIWLYERNVTPCIPPKANRLDPLPYNRACYRKRHLVENFFEAIKTFRRVATRYDKLAETYLGWVFLAVIVKFGM